MTSFDAVAIEAALRARNVALALDFFPTTGSTNEEAKRAARETADGLGLFVADAQTQGRGRASNAWHSPAGENLYFSLLLRPKVRPDAASSMTLAVGVAIAEVLAPLTVRPDELRIKWPNDVLFEGRKLSGILTESQIRGGSVASTVIGVGVNVHGTEFPEALHATSLELAGDESIARATVLAALVASILDAVASFETEGLVPFLERLRRRDALLGASVIVGETRGFARGIDGEGRLLIETTEGIVAVSSGHVVRDR